MPRQPALSRVTVVLGILSFCCLVLYFLALHDIFHDYASPQVLADHGVTTAQPLPGWTTCPGEWKIVGIGFWVMVLFHVLFLVSLARKGGVPSPGQGDPA